LQTIRKALPVFGFQTIRPARETPATARLQVFFVEHVNKYF